MSSQAPSDSASVQAIPPDIGSRLSYWQGLWERSAKYHYFFGVISVAASVISTSVEGTPAKICSIIAAISTSLIGFMHPERRYMKFVRPWRVLEVAAMRYRHGLIDKAALIDAVERGESLIAEFEERYDRTEIEKEAAAANAAAGAVGPVAVTVAGSAAAPSGGPVSEAVPPVTAPGEGEPRAGRPAGSGG
jgi:hypothetical protein